MGPITDDDILQTVSRRAFDAGAAYHRNGCVEEVRATPDGAAIEARVRGSERTPYRQNIQITRGRRGQISIEGSCTCFVGFNCKHVAAALLAYVQQQRRLTAMPMLRAWVPGAAPGPADSATPAAVVEKPLPPDVDAWLRRLDAAQEVETEDYPPTVRKRLLYLLDHGPYSDGVIVSLRSIDLNAQGRTNGRAKRYHPQHITRPGQEARFLRPSDRAILRRLGPGAEQGEAFIATLQAIIATGRGRWAEWDGPALIPGDPVRGTLAWQLADDGRQRPVLDLPDGRKPLRLAALWYIDPASGAMEPIEQVVRAMLSSPALPPETAARVRGEMARRWPQHRLPAPAALAGPEPITNRLQPSLSLLQGELPFDPARTGYGRYDRPPPGMSYRVPLARLSWRYGPVTLPPGETRDVFTVEGQLRQVVRDAAGETVARERLRHLGFGRIVHVHHLPATHPHAGDLMLLDPDPGAWIDLLLDDVPALSAEGWRIDVADDFPWHLASPSGDLSVEVREGSRIDWFDLDLGIMVDGTRVSLAPALGAIAAHDLVITTYPLLAIRFKRPSCDMFGATLRNKLVPNVMVLRLQPHEGIALQFSAKKPGQTMQTQPVQMNFDYADFFDLQPSTGYETLIYDVLIGDPTLFNRADNIEAGWAGVQPILDVVARGGSKVHLYAAGTDGPAAADALSKPGGGSWQDLG